jgi:hypothetical protein
MQRTVNLQPIDHPTLWVDGINLSTVSDLHDRSENDIAELSGFGRSANDGYGFGIKERLKGFHDGLIHKLALSPDGRFVSAASYITNRVKFVKQGRLLLDWGF